MNDNYWKKWYQKFDCQKPSDFAKFCLERIPKKSTILDIGCGNMRDTFYFAENKVNAVGVDMYLSYDEDRFTRNVRYADFYHLDALTFLGSVEGYFTKAVVYARFFLHAIEKKELERFIYLCSVSNLPIYAEARSDRDEKIKKDKSHKRNLINAEKILRLLLDNGYKIEHFEEGRGLAKWKGEDPVIIRFIAKK